MPMPAGLPKTPPAGTAAGSRAAQLSGFAPGSGQDLESVYETVEYELEKRDLRSPPAAPRNPEPREIRSAYRLPKL
jgi:hypothetical protein